MNNLETIKEMLNRIIDEAVTLDEAQNLAANALTFVFDMENKSD